ncbi:FMN-dependent NADH-azoreductase [Thiomicrorhabdus xiamenensis]|uniref:FMN dependent NADH:quinone oxidoreductase n=1 Tax=Thiomicrorhabdus xiamenensis TaxID=2739063 RepID=A0A7D4NQF7_9GAMM|nr:NAD(P)H-dependent oxidoreductase [Thiomicrorhabdus xiamenensis]QKI88797.1 NAD(P)H-dependent oxidoreductase [Thiomicrorhabdus xiamenensis]
MNNIMRIDASLQPVEQSSSKQLGDFLTTYLAPQELNHLDLAQSSIRPIDAEYLAAAFNPEPTSEQQEILRDSDSLIEQLKAADAVIITAPMYNFGVPANLKSFFDQVLRAGKTFRYTEQGPQGLVEDKPVFIILSSGGDYREGAAQAMNYLDGHLKTMLNFIGLKELYFIHAAGLAQGDADQIVQKAKDDILTVLPQLKREQHA